MSEIEKCWYEGKHGKLGEEPLDCLKCKRMFGKVMDRPTDEKIGTFLDGYRLAIMEIALYCDKKEQPIPEYHKNMIQGLEIRFKCAIDRGFPLSHFLLVVKAIEKMERE